MLAVRVTHDKGDGEGHKNAKPKHRGTIPNAAQVRVGSLLHGFVVSSVSILPVECVLARVIRCPSRLERGSGGG